ncbi:hypothetical protein OPW32_17050 [Vibrio europaeus]|uniref:hypothetical protein n=1 Tax=Vibrio europaeus TaxID=300876 RepID=UPI002342080F|nr:hypothetical protein [Vibrio europaeus]MDC5850904.1 hypothetical protein [Vibrio europaeus]
MDEIAKKGTILIPSGPVKHLHFVCSDPVFYPKTTKDSILVVNITSIQDGIEHDGSCVLDVGDHPFITHPSYVYYRRADIFGVDTVRRNIDDGTIDVHSPCGDGTFKRILEGFELSDDVTPKIYNFYQKYCKLED